LQKTIPNPSEGLLPLSEGDFMRSQAPRFLLEGPALLLAGLFLLAGCGGYSDGGLVGDYVAASKCPANGCAEQVADANYISLKAGTSSIVVPTTSNRVDISGDCYASMYPQNLINVSVSQTTGAAVPVEVISANSATPAPTCKRGRFNLVLSTAALPANAAYTVRLEMVGIDTAGARHTNAAGGNASITLRK
jgi:hypothetical protein